LRELERDGQLGLRESKIASVVIFLSRKPSSILFELITELGHPTQATQILGIKSSWKLNLIEEKSRNISTVSLTYLKNTYKNYGKFEEN
jgi:hypothetical protein